VPPAVKVRKQDLKLFVVATCHPERSEETWLGNSSSLRSRI
jgi:hypothetical protein